MKKILITGNAGRDCESKTDLQGNTYASFSVGVQAGTKANPKTDWVEVSCSGKLSEIAIRFVKKGTKLLIEGYPTATAYINKENKAVATLKVYCNTLELLSKIEKPQEDAELYAEGGLEDDNIPF